MLALCESRAPLSAAAAHRIGTAWDAIKLPDDIQCPFRTAPNSQSRIMMPIGPDAVMPGH